MAAHAPTPASASLPEAQLRQAWARVRRATWPATYEEAMQDATLSRLVQINALHPHAPVPTPAPTPAHTPTRAPAPERKPPPPLPERRAPTPPGYDIKRAAANDRDDA